MRLMSTVQGLAILANCFVTVAAANGFGNHMEIVLQAGTMRSAILFQWTFNAAISLATGVGKFAVVTFIMEIEGPVHKWRQRLLVLLVSLNVRHSSGA